MTILNSSPAKRPHLAGRTVALSMTGAMAMAMSACHRENGPLMIAPPSDFHTNEVTALTDTNQAPSSTYLQANSQYSTYLGGHGYYPLYGFPGYYYRPKPGSTVEFIRGASSSYSAGSAEEANENISRGGFGESGGEGGGEGEGHGFGGE
jgi:hypothetical protein